MITKLNLGQAGSTILGTGPNHTTMYSPWGSPMLMETNEVGESVEMIYRQDSTMSGNFGLFPSKVYKIVFSCIDGKWNKSEPIYGEIISAHDEYYIFLNKLK